MNLLDDIYYQKEYISLYLKEGEEIFEFNYTEGDFLFTNLAIKRPIEKIGEIILEEKYFDIETVYGYGGIYSNTDNNLFLQKALEYYKEYCHENQVIADFCRIHPFNSTHKHIKEYYNLHVLDRKTVSVDTTLSNPERWSNYSAKVRNILRKCKRELIVRKSDDIDTFFHLYNKTMQKNNADDFYFFEKVYFEKLLSNQNVELYEVLLNDKVISASFIMYGKEICHYHLSANNYDYKKHNANYFILDSLFDIAHERGIQYFYLGGGRTNQEDDSLLRFKKKFSEIQKDFYIAGIVHNQEIYDKYCKIWDNEKKEEVKYFLKYRLKK
jgi:hypothetical protein